MDGPGLVLRPWRCETCAATTSTSTDSFGLFGVDRRMCGGRLGGAGSGMLSLTASQSPDNSSFLRSLALLACAAYAKGPSTNISRTTGFYI